MPKATYAMWVVNPKGTAYLDGELVEVPADELEQFLIEHHEKIQKRQKEKK
jgi:hypothetical protein